MKATAARVPTVSHDRCTLTKVPTDFLDIDPSPDLHQSKIPTYINPKSRLTSAARSTEAHDCRFTAAGAGGPEQQLREIRTSLFPFLESPWPHFDELRLQCTVL